jgi:hypothetical protein
LLPLEKPGSLSDDVNRLAQAAPTATSSTQPPMRPMPRSNRTSSEAGSKDRCSKLDVSDSMCTNGKLLRGDFYDTFERFLDHLLALNEGDPDITGSGVHPLPIVRSKKSTRYHLDTAAFP